MATAKSKKKNQAKKKRTQKVNKVAEPRVTWNEAVELARLIDETIIKISTGTFGIASNKEIYNNAPEEVKNMVSDISIKVTAARDKLKLEIADIPREPNTEVEEDMYPKYLMTYGNLIDIKDDVFADILPIFGELSVFALDVTEPKTTEPGEEKND